ncbi:MAG: type IV secretory system conjugative DNA transfer family protein [Candidatus Paceibacterota bacterium]
MIDHNEKITYFAETDFRNKQARFGIKAKDRTRHMYVIGKTGMGKSTILENMAIQDIQNGEGLAFIDPHGGTAEKLLDYVPEHRIKDVVYFAPFDAEYPMSFNVLEDIGADKRHLVVSGLMSVFKKIWQDAWSARMEYILNNTLLALLEYPGSTLMGVNKMLSDKDFRKKIVDNVQDPAVKSFWVDEYAKYTEKFAAEATPAIQNKVGQYTLNPLIRNIIGQPKSSFDIRELMDTKKIFIINLSKGRIGEQNMNLLGGMFVTKIYLAAMSRADLSEAEIAKLPPFYLYVDEFQNFANESFSQILSEARKYKFALTVANQYVTQMVEEVRDAIFGNVGSIICYRVGPADADLFEKEFAPQFTAEDIVNLGQFQMYLRLMIDGVGSKPFSARGMAPIPRPEIFYREQIIESSRKVFAHTRAEVEEGIKAWHDTISQKPERPKREEMPAGGNEYQRPREFSDRQFERPRQNFPPRNDAPRRFEGENNRRSFPPTPPRQEAPIHKPFVKVFEKPQKFEQPRASSPKLKSLLNELEKSEPSTKSTMPASMPVLRPEPEKKTLSLHNLNKASTGKSLNLSGLKDVLASALKDMPEKPRPAPAPAPKKESEPEEKITTNETQKKQTKEVPEDVLRKILE